MALLTFRFEYDDQEYYAKAIKMEANDLLTPAKFHIYGLIPSFKMFKGPVVLIANRDGQAISFARFGTMDHFKSAVITALYKHCHDNSIDIF